MRKTKIFFFNKSNPFTAKIIELENDNKRLRKENETLTKIKELQAKRDEDYLRLQRENIRLLREIDEAKDCILKIKRQLILLKKNDKKEEIKDENN